MNLRRCVRRLRSSRRLRSNERRRDVANSLKPTRASASERRQTTPGVRRGVQSALPSPAFLILAESHIRTEVAQRWLMELAGACQIRCMAPTRFSRFSRLARPEAIHAGGYASDWVSIPDEK